MRRQHHRLHHHLPHGALHIQVRPRLRGCQLGGWVCVRGLEQNRRCRKPCEQPAAALTLAQTQAVHRHSSPSEASMLSSPTTPPPCAQLTSPPCRPNVAAINLCPKFFALGEPLGSKQVSALVHEMIHGLVSSVQDRVPAGWRTRSQARMGCVCVLSAPQCCRAQQAASRQDAARTGHKTAAAQFTYCPVDLR